MDFEHDREAPSFIGYAFGKITNFRCANNVGTGFEGLIESSVKR